MIFIDQQLIDANCIEMMHVVCFWHDNNNNVIQSAEKMHDPKVVKLMMLSNSDRNFSLRHASPKIESEIIPSSPTA